MSGVVIWFTGLPCSGKSQLARRVQARLAHEAVPCCLLDGDRVRGLLRPEPGYSATERDNFYMTLGNLALELAQQGLVVLVPATANRRLYRDQVRARAQRFIEVWMTAALDECRLRDVKGLYANFAKGEVQGLPGEDLVYEAPELPEVTARGAEDEEALTQVLRCLRTPGVPPRA